jgi:hypothetical protein
MDRIPHGLGFEDSSKDCETKPPAYMAGGGMFGLG